MNDEIETKNAKIESTMLGWEDHGIFTFSLYLDYGGSGQGAGGYALDRYEKKIDKRVGWSGGIAVLMRILKVVGVEKWEDLPGQVVRVRAGWERVHAVGNYLREDWLDFEGYFKELIQNEKQEIA